MNIHFYSGLKALLQVMLCTTLLACGGGGGGSSAPLAETPVTPPPPEPAPEPVPTQLTNSEATRFLSQATFGPNAASVEATVDSGLEAWFLAELEKPASTHLDNVLERFPADGGFLDDQGNTLPQLVYAASDSFWQTVIEADDQLRQRMAYALSQIMVVSAQSNLDRVPQTMAAYMDVLTLGAFGNYRDLVQDVTYSPAMAEYLTYLRNEKADPATGRVPDENYARELMQLFTIGLVELNQDGTAVPGPDGAPIELFDNTDITNLAKVFTGLSVAGASFNTPLRSLPSESFYQPLQMFGAFHSTEEKRFLGITIAANTPGNQSISLALDAIVGHPNVGPFISRQLIQRFVTSDPSPDYVSRVAAAFNTGRYALPSGTQVGEGVRGDLAATIGAILFDEEARSSASADNTRFGKLREPVLRFTHWARAFNVNSADARNERLLRDTSSSDDLGQHPYLSPSVFNFYRPGYIAPGTETGAAGLTAPEFQITNATSIMGYANFLTRYVAITAPQVVPGLPRAFIPDYSIEMELADNPAALIDHLDQLLTHGTMLDETRARITEALEVIDPGSGIGLERRVKLAILMVMTSPEYIVLR